MIIDLTTVTSEPLYTNERQGSPYSEWEMRVHNDIDSAN